MSYKVFSTSNLTTPSANWYFEFSPKSWDLHDSDQGQEYIRSVGGPATLGYLGYDVMPRFRQDIFRISR